MNRKLLLALAYTAIAIALLAARPVPTPGPVARDFEAYWSAGATWNAGSDPYTRSVWQAERVVPGVDARRYDLLPFIDPPSTLPLWSVFARLPYDIAVTVWLALLAGAFLALVWTVLFNSAPRLTGSNLLAALAIATAFGPITSDLALGQLALPAFLGAMLVVVFADRSLPGATAAATLAFAAPNVALGLISQVDRKRVATVLGLGALATYALGVWGAGWGWPPRYFENVLSHGAAERFVAIQLTPAAIAYGLGASPWIALTIAALAALLAVAATILFVIRVRDPFARFAGSSALVPFIAGFVHEHALILAFPAAIWCAFRAQSTARALALAGTLLVAVDWLGLAQRPTGIAQSALLALAAACAFVAAGKIDSRSLVWVVAIMAGLFAVSSALAVYHPAPVWPDAMSSLHAPADASVATIWLAEQRASGLLAVAPAWALLRACSLLGCAILACVIYRHSSCCRTA